MPFVVKNVVYVTMTFFILSRIRFILKSELENYVSAYIKSAILFTFRLMFCIQEKYTVWYMCPGCPKHYLVLDSLYAHLSACHSKYLNKNTFIFYSILCNLI
jgi:hypothetical protein